MEPVITAAQAAEWDARSSLATTELMERAGMAVAIAAASLGASYGRRVVVLTGPGNNGGDGYVAARHLARRGAAVEVLALAEPRSEACRWARGRAEGSGVEVSPWRLPKESEDPFLIVDALFGAGFRGRLPDEVAAWTTAKSPVVSVDVPSGLDATTGAIEGPCFKASVTVTFGAMKVGHLIGSGPEHSGQVTVVDIGLGKGPFEFGLCQLQDAPRPGRPRAGHKWSVGSVMVVGGSPGIAGALWLAGRAALNAGAGSVTLCLPADLRDHMESAELMSVRIGAGERYAPGDADEVLVKAARFDVLVVGPGLGHGQEGFVRALIEGREGPLLLDADALNALDGPSILAKSGSRAVITPHAGEFRKLTGSEPDYRNAADVAASSSAIVVLKGNPTFVAGDELWAVTTGGPELATIGTGDVLAGTIAALWARGLEGEVAARAGAYWHGMAGAALSKQGTVTSDRLAEEISAWVWA